MLSERNVTHQLASITSTAIPGRPNSLGHAWGPGPDRAGLNGDVHFDEDDDWTDETRFLGVAIHELGHSLGLTHSKDPEAIMFPAYAERAELGQDDIRGAQFLYGEILLCWSFFKIKK